MSRLCTSVSESLCNELMQQRMTGVPMGSSGAGAGAGAGVRALVWACVPFSLMSRAGF